MHREHEIEMGGGMEHMEHMGHHQMGSARLPDGNLLARSHDHDVADHDVLHGHVPLLTAPHDARGLRLEPGELLYRLVGAALRPSLVANAPATTRWPPRGS
jgi:hypothetical protein